MATKKYYLLTYDGKPLNVYTKKRGAERARTVLLGTGNRAPIQIDHLTLDEIRGRMFPGQDNLALYGHGGL